LIHLVGGEEDTMIREEHDLQPEVMAADRDAYSDVIIDHATHPRNRGSMENADAFASVTGRC
jgi:hypothetical protein